MGRVFFVLTVLALVFAVAYGAAASLTVDGGVVQSGSDTTLTCDADGVTVSYAVTWNNTTKQFEISQVTVSGIDNSCDGKTIAVQLTKSDGTAASGTSLKTMTIPSDATQTSVTLSGFTSPASEVTDVHVAIY